MQGLTCFSFLRTEKEVVLLAIFWQIYMNILDTLSTWMHCGEVDFYFFCHEIPFQSTLSVECSIQDF